ARGLPGCGARSRSGVPSAGRPRDGGRTRGRGPFRPALPRPRRACRAAEAGGRRPGGGGPGGVAVRPAAERRDRGRVGLGHGGCDLARPRRHLGRHQLVFEARHAFGGLFRDRALLARRRQRGTPGDMGIPRPADRGRDALRGVQGEGPGKPGARPYAGWSLEGARSGPRARRSALGPAGPPGRRPGMNRPARMRAVEISRPGGPEVLQVTEVPVPKPGPGQILIEVAYAGVNRPDALQRAGAYAPPPSASPLPGLEAAGRIAVLGPGVSDWAVGDPVTALLPGGGYAGFAVTPAAHALPVPKGMGLREAACLPETCFTVWSNVVMRGGLRAGERFLVHGGSSGIGTTAIQIAGALGARVLATAGAAEKCAACEAPGA